MRALTFTRLWPNAVQPQHGIFVEERMRRFAARPGCALSVVAPVPWAPRVRALPARWSWAARVPMRESRHGIAIEHPRYAVLPKVGYALQGRSLARTAARAIASACAREPVELIDAHFLYPDGYAAVCAGVELGIPVVVTARGSDARNVSPSIRSAVRFTLARATRLIAVSADLRDRMIELGASPARVRVVPNGIDAGRFRFTPAGRAGLRSALGAGRGDSLLLSVGRLERVKGFDVLVDAIAALAARPGAPRVRAIVVGAGSERAWLEARARRRGVAERILFAGSVAHDELDAWYSAADLFVMPSRAEGHPNALTEALACGTPVVASAVGAIPAIVPETSGRLVAPGDPARLADAIVREIAEARSREVVRSAVAGRSWDDVAAEVHSVFRDAIGAWAHGGAEAA